MKELFVVSFCLRLVFVAWLCYELFSPYLPQGSHWYSGGRLFARDAQYSWAVLLLLPPMKFPTGRIERAHKTTDQFCDLPELRRNEPLPVVVRGRETDLQEYLLLKNRKGQWRFQNEPTQHSLWVCWFHGICTWGEGYLQTVRFFYWRAVRKNRDHGNIDSY